MFLSTFFNAFPVELPWYSPIAVLLVILGLAWLRITATVGSTLKSFLRTALDRGALFTEQTSSSNLEKIEDLAKKHFVWNNEGRELLIRVLKTKNRDPKS